MSFVIAQIAGGAIVQSVIFAIVICGVLGILIVVARKTGITIPSWAISIFWIVVLVIVAVFAVKILASLLW